MPLIHVTNRAGDSYSVDADTGLSLMDVLRERGDVEAICGGSCACATCHVHIEESWLTQVGAPESDEQALLEYSLERQPGSRLACQVRINNALDGLVLHVAASEG